MDAIENIEIKFCDILAWVQLELCGIFLEKFFGLIFGF